VGRFLSILLPTGFECVAISKGRQRVKTEHDPAQMRERRVQPARQTKGRPRSGRAHREQGSRIPEYSRRGFVLSGRNSPGGFLLSPRRAHRPAVGHSFTILAKRTCLGSSQSCHDEILALAACRALGSGVDSALGLTRNAILTINDR
jgi:hypothetical protein